MPTPDRPVSTTKQDCVSITPDSASCQTSHWREMRGRGWERRGENQRSHLLGEVTSQPPGHGWLSPREARPEQREGRHWACTEHLQHSKATCWWVAESRGATCAQGTALDMTPVHTRLDTDSQASGLGPGLVNRDPGRTDQLHFTSRRVTCTSGTQRPAKPQLLRGRSDC